MNVVCYQFKHYRNQTLELRASLQVIVGNNGSGKSTLCEALSIMANASNPHHTSWEEKTSFLKEVSRHETEDLLMKKSSVTPEA